MIIELGLGHACKPFVLEHYHEGSNEQTLISSAFQQIVIIFKLLSSISFSMMLLFQLFFTIKVNLHVNVVNYKASVIFSPFPRRKDLTILRDVQLSYYYFHYLLDIIFEIDY